MKKFIELKMEFLYYDSTVCLNNSAAVDAVDAFDGDWDLLD